MTSNKRKRADEPVVRLEALRSPDEKSYTFDGFQRVVEAHEASAVLPALREVEDAGKSGLYAAGFIAYEAAPGLDEAMVTLDRPDGLPLVWFALYAERKETVPAGCEGSAPEVDWKPSVEASAYGDDIGSIKTLIRAGDTYQVNYSYRMRSDSPSSVEDLYDQLKGAQRADFCAFINTGRFQILSASPELFFRLRGRAIETRPMKGTRPRAPSLEDDDRLSEDLASSEKDRAENLMIVDLLRNDLGRVCEPGSVSVGRLWKVERYETVQQMTSEVRGTLRSDVSFSEVVQALFPCGSVTGAPKVRTMEIIRDHEGAPRGVYTGAIGTLGPDGDATFSVAIRTAVVDEATKIAEYGVGGGITHDSTEVGELTECVVKTDILTAHWPRFSLFETLRYNPGEGYFLLGRHLDRMAGSARYFGFPFDAERAKGVLEETSGDAERTTRVRLMLDRTGHFVSEVQAWTESNSLSAVVSHIPVDSSDPFLYHKTTHRAVYEAQFKRYRNVADMVVFVNERREVTECLVGNVALRQGGRWFTPPESSGLLRGTYRDELLSRGEIQERVLYPEDLATAESVSMINSVREWVPLELVQASGTAAAG